MLSSETGDIFVCALYPFRGSDSNQLSFDKGDAIQVLQRLESGWHEGIHMPTGLKGWFPSNFVTTESAEFQLIKPGTSTATRKLSIKTYQLSLKLGSASDMALGSSAATSSSSNIESGGNFDTSKYYHSYSAHIDKGLSNNTDTPTALPSSWSLKLANEGRSFNYNLQTNENLWSLKDGQTAERKLFRAAARNDLNPLEIDTKSNTDQYSNMMESPESPISFADFEWNWRFLQDRMKRAIFRALKYAVQGKINSYTKQAHRVVEEARVLLYASGTPNHNSSLLESEKFIKHFHHEFTMSLSKYVLAVKCASALWPEPDAGKKLVKSIHDLTAATDNFVNSLSESNIPVTPVDRINLPCSIGRDISLSNTEWIALVEMRAQNVSKSLKALDSLDFSREGKSTATESLVDESSALLGLIDALPIDIFPKETTNALIDKRQALFGEISHILASLNFPSPSISPSGTGNYTANIKTLLEQIVFQFKKVIEEKDKLESASLQTYIAQHHRRNRGLSDMSISSRKKSISSFSSGEGGKAMHINTVADELYSPTGALTPISSSLKSALSTRSLRSPYKDDLWVLDVPAPADLQFESDNKLVKSGSLKSLIEWMVLKDDVSYTHHVMFMYRYYMNSSEFVDSLLRYFSIQLGGDSPIGESTEVWNERRLYHIRLRVINLLKIWVDQFSSRQDPNDVAALEMVTQFAKSSFMTKMFSSDAAQLIRSLNMPKTGCKKYGEAPAPLLPKNLRRFKLTDLDTLEIARQLSLIEFSVFSTMQYSELQAKAWSDKNRPEVAANVRKMISLSNKVTGWVQFSILSESDTKARASIIKHFIYIADRCRYLHNYNSVMAILAALASSPIHRLGRSWELLSQRTKGTYASLRKLMDPARNFFNYREALADVNSLVPCIPFLGVNLTDLTFIEDGNPATTKEGLINFNKHIKTNTGIQDLLRRQNVGYNFVQVEEIYHAMHVWVFTDGSRLGEAELWNLSTQLEPKEREDEKLTRILSETGFF